MRRALNRVSLSVHHRKDSCFHIAAVRLHDLDFISDAEFIALRNPDDAAARLCLRIPVKRREVSVKHLLRDAKPHSIADIGIVVIDHGFFRRLAEIESGCESSVCALFDLVQIPGHVRAVLLFTFEVIVNCLPVGSRDRRDI